MPVISRTQKALIKERIESIVAESCALADLRLSHDAKTRVLQIMSHAERIYALIEETED